MIDMEKNNASNAPYDKGVGDGPAGKSGPMTIAVSEILLINMENPGVAFPFVKALVNVNDHFHKLYPDSEFPFHIALMTKNQAQEQHIRNHLNKLGGVCLEQALLTVNGLESDTDMPFNFVLMTNNLNHEKYLRDRLSELGLSEIDVHQEDYISQLDTKILYLSEDPEKAEKAIKNGHAAAIMFPNDTNNKETNRVWRKRYWECERLACVKIPPPSTDQIQLRVAFDGDNVLFSQDPESAKAIHGLESFKQNEDEKQDVPLREGPLKCFLEALVNMEKKFHAKHPNENFPVQTFLVTARNPVISGTRVLKTLKSWGLELTQAFFLSGTPKGPPLSMIQPHIFFDDRKMHVNEGLELGVVSALVPYGIGYETDKEAKEEEANHGDKQGNSVSIN